MGAAQPFMYSAESRSGSGFPQSAFDPKAVTRASWEPKPRRPSQNGPLVSFNRHPDSHMLLTTQTNHHLPPGRRTKKCIKWLRNAQFALRLFQLGGALGLLVLMILVTGVEATTGWVLRIALGIAILHCFYAMYHLARRAAGRTPGSSAAYHAFAAVSDIAVAAVFAFGILATHRSGDTWTTRLENSALMRYFIPALYYGLLVTAVLHLVSLSISLWLGMAFRKISLMPPDMNPLEDHLTARPQYKRPKTSSTSFTGIVEEKKRLDSFVSSGSSYTSSRPGSRPVSVPFLHTRTGSSHSGQFWGSRGLPQRQYQIVPGNPSQNLPGANSSNSIVDPRAQQLNRREPLRAGVGNHTNSRVRAPSSGNTFEGLPSTWGPNASQYNRRNIQSVADQRLNTEAHARKSYEALAQQYEEETWSGSDYDDENQPGSGHSVRSMTGHPNPLQLHPASNYRQSHTGSTKAPTSKGSDSSLTELSANSRSTIHEATPGASTQLTYLDNARFATLPKWRDGTNTPQPLKLQSIGFVGINRKISSGVDYDFNRPTCLHERRNISGKAAEEGRIM